MSALTLLTSLSLNGNGVRDLSPLQFLQLLNRLSLARNNLTGDMLEPLTALGTLKSLNVSENNIETFTHLGEFANTVAIDLSGNPIVSSASQSFLDLCILHRDAPTPFGETIRAISGEGGPCKTINDRVLANITLDLSKKNISSVEPLGALGHLSKLNVSENVISDVSALSRLTNLTELNVSGNDIVDIRPLGQLKRLTNFNASGNPVSLDDFLSACLMRQHEGVLTDTQMTEVKALIDISGQSTCQEAHDTLQEIEEADASGRGLTTLDYFGVMENLHTINLSNNQLTDLTQLNVFERLINLIAQNNLIKSMDAVKSIRKLEKLNLLGNPLQNLNGIVDLRKLREINFSRTKVRSIQPLVSMPFLTEVKMQGLSLSFNSFSEYCLVSQFDSVALAADRAFMEAIQPILVAAKVDTRDCQAVEHWARTITSLTLNKKQIASIKPIVFFTALQNLYLYDNNIRDAQPIRQLRQLKNLNLTDNRLTSLPSFQSFQMNVLSLNNNNISNIHNLANLRQLKSLSLRNNKISDPSPVSRLSKLTWLDLRENKIVDANKAMKVVARKPYFKDNPICQGLFHVPIQRKPLLDACKRVPPKPKFILNQELLRFNNNEMFRRGGVNGRNIIINPR